MRLRAALEPFRSGEWGKVLAWIVEGAPTRADGIAAARLLRQRLYAADEALAAPTDMKAAIEVAADKMADGGYPIPLPWNGDLDDEERGKFETFEAAIKAAMEHV